jgi:hypothetical protein
MNDYTKIHAEYAKLAETMHKQLRRQAIESAEYKALIKRRYRDPEGYGKHKEVMLDIVTNLMMGFQITEDTWNHSQNSSRTCTALVQEWYMEKSSSYWLDQNLFEAFQRTDIPEKIGDLKQVIPSGLIMLPKGLRTPEGENLKWIVFAHRLKQEPAGLIRLGKMVFHGQPQDYDFVAWAAITPSTTVYANLFKVDHAEQPELLDGGWLGVQNAIADVEQEFIRQVTSIVIQTLLIAQIEPQLLEAESTIQGKRQGGFSKRNQDKWLSPNWIGRNYTPRKPSAKASVTTGRQLPFHWRRGHFRRVVVGERSQNQREWRWVQPYPVGLEEN